MISKLAKRRASNAMKAMESRRNSIEKLNESVESAKPDVLNENAAATFGIKSNKRRNLINNVKERNEKTIEKFSDGLTEIVLESYCFDSNKVEEIKDATRDNVKKFIVKLFHEGLIEVNDIIKNPSMVVKIFAEEVTKDLDKNKPSEIEKPEKMKKEEIRNPEKLDNNDRTNKTKGIEEVSKDDKDSKEEKKNAEKLPNPDLEDLDKNKNSEIEKPSKAVKLISETVKEKVIKNVKRNIEIAKDAKKKIDEVKETKDDALTEKMVNEEMENFDPKEIAPINPFHFQVITDLINEDFVDDDLETDETDEAEAEKNLKLNTKSSDDDEYDELDELFDDEDEDEEQALMRVIAMDPDTTYHEDVMEKVELNNSKATNRSQMVLMNGIKRGLIKDHKANTLKMFMQEAMNHANLDQNVIDADYMSFHEDFATCNAIVNYTILETLNTMNLIKNEDQRDEIINVFMR